MQKALILTGILLFAIIGSLFLVKQFVGDLRPSVLPSLNLRDQNISNSDKKNSGANESYSSNSESELAFAGENMPFELNVPPGYEIKLFGRENGARDLAVGDDGELLVTSPGRGEAVGFKVNNGKVEKNVVIDRLSSPHGIAFYQGKLFIAEENRLARYSWNSGSLRATFEKELMKLPSGGHDAHTLAFDKSGNLYIKIGSSCNVCKETDPQRAAVIKTDQEGNNPTVFAGGLRNAAFMTLNEESNQIWATENGRDNLGDNLPPEEVNILSEGRDYGWPLCYGTKIHDTQFDRNTYIKDPCEDSQPPAFEMQAHSAPLGLSFIPETFSNEWKGDLLVAFHGSWNRSVPTGYKIVRLNFENGKVVGQEDFITGFLKGSSASGRPVDLVFDKSGNLYISDDKGGNIFVLSKK